MTRWIPYAFVRLTLCLATGIAVGITFAGRIPPVFVAAGTIGCILFYGGVFVWGRLGKYTINPGAIALLAVAAAGFALVSIRTPAFRPGHISNLHDSIAYYQGVVDASPESRGLYWRTTARVQRLRTATGWQNAEGRILLLIAKADFPQSFQYGDVLLLKGQPQRVPGPANPGEFDYRTYLANRNILYQHVITQGTVYKEGHAPPSYTMAAAIQARQWADKTLRRFVPGQQEQALVVALVLGVTDSLDPELLQAYGNTGTMHVLAVSGLHISILYFIIMIMLRPLKRLPPQYSRWILAAVSLLLLWGYAFVTGLSPSVLRAVVMFTLMALSKLRRQPANMYNTLAASAFLLLLYDPYNLTAVGFQLSYLAVLGIVAIHPLIEKQWKPRNIAVGKLWEMTSLSIAAQLATFPLGLLYFHQFPNYFLFANLVAIPGSFIILVAGLLVLAAGIVPIIAVGIGTMLGWLVKAMNAIITAIGTWPFGLTDNVYITPLQCTLLLLAVMCGVIHFRFKKPLATRLLVMCIMGFAALQWQQYYAVANVRKLAIYNVPGQSALDILDRGIVYFMADSALYHDTRKIRFHIAPHRMQHRVLQVRQDIPFQCTFPGIHIIAPQGIAIMQIVARPYTLPRKIKVDVLILSHNAVYDLQDVITHVEAGRIVLDSSNSPRYIDRIMQVANKLNISVYAVRYNGAYACVF